MKIAIPLILFILCMGMCIYDAANNSMFCVVWAVNALLNYNNFTKSVENENDN